MALSEMSNKLGLALDVPTQAKAKPILRQLADYVGTIKFHAFADRMGLDAAVKFLRPYKKQLFWDAKLSDTPETIALRIKQAVDLKIDLVTVHASAGLSGLEAAVEACKGSQTKILAVTLLTSLKGGDVKNIYNNADVGKKLWQFACMIDQHDIYGLVCAVDDLSYLRSLHETKNMFMVTPGIRLEVPGRNSDSRNGTPTEAIAKESDLLIVGSALLTPSKGTRMAAAENILRLMNQGIRKAGADALWPIG